MFRGSGGFHGLRPLANLSLNNSHNLFQTALHRRLQISSLLYMFMVWKRLHFDSISPVMPHDIVFVHFMISIIRQSFCIQLSQRCKVFLFKISDFALSQKKPFSYSGYNVKVQRGRGTKAQSGRIYRNSNRSFISSLRYR